MEKVRAPVSSSNVYVASLPAHYTEECLRKLMSPFGNIVSVRVMRDARTGRCKGYGFVLFETEREAACAINSLIAHVVDGSRIQVRFAHAAASPRPLVGGPSTPPAATVQLQPASMQPVYMLSPQPQPNYGVQPSFVYSTPEQPPADQHPQLVYYPPPPPAVNTRLVYYYVPRPSH